MSEQSPEMSRRVPDTLDSSLVLQTLNDFSKLLNEAYRLHREHFVPEKEGFFDTDDGGNRIPMTGERLAAFLGLKLTIDACTGTYEELVDAYDMACNFGARDPRVRSVWKEGRALSEKLAADIHAARTSSSNE